MKKYTLVRNQRGGNEIILEDFRNEHVPNYIKISPGCPGQKVFVSRSERIVDRMKLKCFDVFKGIKVGNEDSLAVKARFERQGAVISLSWAPKDRP